MDSVGRLKLIIIGLILLAIGVGYFIFAQRTRVSDNTRIVTRSPLPSVIVIATPTPSPTVIAQASPLPATGISGTSTLPATGVPLVLVGIFSASASLIGFGLKRFPK